MAKLQLTPDWMIGPKNAGKALVMWLVIAVAVIGTVWFVSQGALGAETEVANETVAVEKSTDLVYADITTTASADGSNISTVELINESGGSLVNSCEHTGDRLALSAPRERTREIDARRGNRLTAALTVGTVSDRLY